VKSLYEISQSIIDALENAERHAMENEGEITEEMSKELDTLHMEKEIKIGNICKYYKSLLAEADMIKSEEENLAARRTVSENKAKRLKEYLSSMMSDGEKFSDSVSKVSWRKSTSVEISDESVVSDMYKIKTVTVKVNKKLIKTVLKSGTVPGAKLVESENIQIK
jgi:hypothetical protein